jgi:hypothetical protein
MSNQLLRAEARELVRHRAAGGSDDYIAKRALVVDRLYGPGSRNSIRELMKTIEDHDLCGVEQQGMTE